MVLLEAPLRSAIVAREDPPFGAHTKEHESVHRVRFGAHMPR